ncbi:MAG TPA: DNA-formamidopyrimidine glycosylase family protein [Vicinamibacterales bacterium]|jgi:endonuclease-8|nr:DNA-formamidopyrimidine glycosylase family protein [Vicinamibacterales bacterium]
MPEGDTIFRAARTLNRALAGKTVTRFEAAFPKLTRVHEDTPIVGRTIQSVSARGKHILMTFGPSTRFARSGQAPSSRVARSGQGLVLRTHMRMNGSWHIYRPGERWQRPRSDMRIVIATSDFVAVGFSIPVAEWLDTRALSRQDDLRRLGPDLLGADFDAEEALARLRGRSTEPIAHALLNQRVMAGIGNVYKSEVLFACRVNPFLTVADLNDEQLRCLIATARKFLQANVSERVEAMTTYMGFRRTTRRDAPSERLWVYGRAGEPCRRCGAAIQIDKRGADARLTYWCGTCQR